ncbi:MAG TPA: hypothetical protein DEA47_05480 [Peptococcaceae bacterium]|nr:MAG: Uncharacterized protein XD50_1258 [Clostridia bacterium 41_269]HBT20795.1 hypothetical protein [Peptococcaceae bacterium]
MAVITVSRQFGSRGEFVAEILSEATGFLLLNKKTLHKYIGEHELPEMRLDWINEISPRNVDGLEKERVEYVNTLKKTITDLSQNKPVILLGRGGQFLFKGSKDAVHIKIVASIEARSSNIQKRFNVDKATALRLINEKDAEREAYTYYFHRGDWNDPEIYDLTINTTRMSLGEAAELILHFLKQKKLISRKRFEKVLAKVEEAAKEKEKIAAGYETSAEGDYREKPKKFANKSEEEFARILDYYKIKYLYEPTTFPLKWDSEGNIESAFTPDFYFPDFDLYIELTTMKQELVTKKNRKVRELKRLYPDVNIKLFYRKDYKKLLEKFGINPDEADSE